MGSFDPQELDAVLPEPLPAEPFATIRDWFDQAHRDKVQPNPNAITLATVDPATGRPSARIVLCKSIDPLAGFLVFYTNRLSTKGKHLAAKPEAAAVFHWDAMERQVRVEGPVVHAPDAESDAYFATRPWEARIGAWASRQSEPIGSRAELLAQVAATMARLGINLDMDPAKLQIPRPPHWGGYRLYARRVELWAGGPGRIHDRAAWTRDLTPAGSEFRAGPWRATRLQP